MKFGRASLAGLWLALILAVVAAERIHQLRLPLERDEGEYAYAGQLMLEGVPPYQLMYNMKMPGIYAAYALSMALFGESPAGIHLGFMLVNLGAILLIYFVGRRFLPPAGAVAASAAYALLSVSPMVLGLNAHATHFVVLAALGATLVLLRASERGGLVGFFWSGLLFGLAFLMKQPGGAFAFFGAAVIAWKAWGQPRTEWKLAARRLAVFAGGVAAPIVLTCLILWRAGVWDRFRWWTLTYASTHASALPWAVGKLRLRNYLVELSWDASFWWLALAGLIVVLAGKSRAEEKFFFLALLFFSVAAVAPTFHFTSHYFVLLLPVLSLLAAKAAAWAASRLAGLRWALARTAPWILFGLIWAGVAWSHLYLFVLSGPASVARQMYSANEFEIYPAVAEYLKAHSRPAATVAVLGSEPELPFYAHRRSITGYIYMYDLVQNQPFRERMAREMISEVERGRADYVIIVNLYYSWMPNPPASFDEISGWFMRYTQKEYDPFGVVTFPPSICVWGTNCLRDVPLGHRFLTIFKRKPAQNAR